MVLYKKLVEEEREKLKKKEEPCVEKLENIESNLEKKYLFNI